MIQPIFTEKTTRLAKEGKYTFLVSARDVKSMLKSEIASLFKVHVKSIKTLKVGGEAKRNSKGIKVTKLASKKAIVTLKAGEKIDLFDEKKKKK